MQTIVEEYGWIIITVLGAFVALWFLFPYLWSFFKDQLSDMATPQPTDTTFWDTIKEQIV